MWSAGKHSLQWEGAGNTLSFSVFHPDYVLFSGEILFVPEEEKQELGYDHWVQCFQRNDEIGTVQNAIDSLQKNPRRIHIVGVSCSESVALLATYYASLGYENALAHNYLLPEDVLLTASISLRHLLWCEKDKAFLQKKDIMGNSYYALVPPLRTPSDLRALQQGVRMGIIPCVDVLGDTSFLDQLLEKQILTPFQMTQIVGSSWRKYGFSGNVESCSIVLPDFSQEIQDELLL
ncbi:hypothetical protein KA057_02970 [Candidatus Gracilibacteria bacterium]|nr:hypothetical protein [Candidatus Gracilibacteria bacterium]